MINYTYISNILTDGYTIQSKIIRILTYDNNVINTNQYIEISFSLIFIIINIG